MKFWLIIILFIPELLSAAVFPKAGQEYQLTGLLFLSERAAVFSINPRSDSQLAISLENIKFVSKSLKRPRYFGPATLKVKIERIEDSRRARATALQVEKAKFTRPPVYDSNLKELK